MKFTNYEFGREDDLVSPELNGLRLSQLLQHLVLAHARRASTPPPGTMVCLDVSNSYSYLRASIGSTLAARRDGIHDARAATATIITTTPIIVRGS